MVPDHDAELPAHARRAGDRDLRRTLPGPAAPDGDAPQAGPNLTRRRAHAMGVAWMTVEATSQAIPPAYSEVPLAWLRDREGIEDRMARLGDAKKENVQ